MHYTRDLADTINAVTMAGANANTQFKILKEITEKLNEVNAALDGLKAAVAQANNIEDSESKARAYKDKVLYYMNELRKPVDELEMMVDKNLWPMPTYGDILFY